MYAEPAPAESSSTRMQRRLQVLAVVALFVFALSGAAASPATQTAGVAAMPTAKSSATLGHGATTKGRSPLDAWSSTSTARTAHNHTHAHTQAEPHAAHARNTRKVLLKASLCAKTQPVAQKCSQLSVFDTIS